MEIVAGWGDEADFRQGILRAARGIEDCVQLIDATEFPGTPAEDAVVSIRLSDDGGTLWVNNQLSKTLIAETRGRGQNGTWFAIGRCPVAPNWVLELDLDPAVESVTLSGFQFRGAVAEDRNPKCVSRRE